MKYIPMIHIKKLGKSKHFQRCENVNQTIQKSKKLEETNTSVTDSYQWQHIV